MPIDANAMSELILDTDHAVAEVELRIARLQRELITLSQERAEIHSQAVALRGVFVRLFPGASVPSPVATEHASRLHAVRITQGEPQGDDLEVSNGWTRRDDWSHLPRTEAVAKAVAEITLEDRFAAPSDIERQLQLHGRSDSRDDIGGALSYLNRKGVVRSQGRGRWVPAPSSDSEQSSTSDLLDEDLRVDAQTDAEIEAWEDRDGAAAIEVREAALIEEYERARHEGF